MNEQFGDARLEELKLLSQIDRQGELQVGFGPGPFRDLVAYLVHERLVNHLNPRPGTISLRAVGGLPGESELERMLHSMSIEDLFKVLEGSETKLRLSHRGRVRLSELKQALRAGREREPFGILWDVRHWEQDVQIEILEAREASPLALAYLDMNGLKQINDTHGHDAGDLALRTYFQAVASVLGDRGQAYRLSGGADEVLVALPNCDERAAVQFLRLACTKLMNDRLWPTDPNALLSIAAGVIINTDPTALPGKLRASADEEQKRAKQRSKETAPRPSVIAINGKRDLVVIEHDSTGFPVKIVAGVVPCVLGWLSASLQSWHPWW
jgi:diguanylate cyclase (GGDEF)-like protein